MEIFVNKHILDINTFVWTGLPAIKSSLECTSILLLLYVFCQNTKKNGLNHDWLHLWNSLSDLISTASHYLSQLWRTQGHTNHSLAHITKDIFHNYIKLHRPSGFFLGIQLYSSWYGDFVVVLFIESTANQCMICYFYIYGQFYSMIVLCAIKKWHAVTNGLRDKIVFKSRISYNCYILTMLQNVLVLDKRYIYSGCCWLMSYIFITIVCYWFYSEIMYFCDYYYHHFKYHVYFVWYHFRK